MKRINDYLTKYKLLDSEARQLSKFANQIKGEYQINTKINQKRKKQLYRQVVGVNHYNRLNNFKFRYAIATVVVVVFSLTSVVVLAQNSQPGDSLYSIKKASQTVRLWIQPSYIKIMVKDRKLETEKLIEENAAESDVDEAKREYSESVERAINTGYSTQIEQDINSSIIENNTNNNVEKSHNYNGTNEGAPIDNNIQPTPTNGQRNQNNKIN